MVIHQAIVFIGDHEGFREKVYLDSLGYPTIGYGQKVSNQTYQDMPEALRSFPRMPEKVAEAWLEHHVNYDYQWALALPWFTKLSPLRQVVILSMAYQMGRRGLLGFKQMIKCIEEDDYYQAGKAMLDSRWARQTPKRAEESAVMMVNNQKPRVNRV